jgi:hypothetical protein
MAIYVNTYLYLMMLVMPTFCWSLWLSSPRKWPSTYLRSNSKCCPIFPIIPVPHMLLLFETGVWLDCWLFFIRCLHARGCPCYRNSASTTWWWRCSDRVERGSWVDCALYKSLLLLGWKAWYSGRNVFLGSRTIVWHWSTSLPWISWPHW